MLSCHPHIGLWMCARSTDPKASQAHVTLAWIIVGPHSSLVWQLQCVMYYFVSSLLQPSIQVHRAVSDGGGEFTLPRGFAPHRPGVKCPQWTPLLLVIPRLLNTLVYSHFQPAPVCPFLTYCLSHGGEGVGPPGLVRPALYGFQVTYRFMNQVVDKVIQKTQKGPDDFSSNRESGAIQCQTCQINRLSLNSTLFNGLSTWWSTLNTKAADLTKAKQQ